MLRHRNVSTNSQRECFYMPFAYIEIFRVTEQHCSLSQHALPERRVTPWTRYHRAKTYRNTQSCFTTTSNSDTASGPWTQSHRAAPACTYPPLITVTDSRDCNILSTAANGTLLSSSCAECILYDTDRLYLAEQSPNECTFSTVHVL